MALLTQCGGAGHDARQEPGIEVTVSETMSRVAERVMLGARAMRSVRVVDGGRTLHVELDDTDGGSVSLFIPAEVGLTLGSELMVAAARAKSEREIGS